MSSTSSPLFHASNTSTDSNNFKPSEKLPEHLTHFQEIGKDTRKKMTDVMQSLLELTDKMALRGAATLQEVN
ncbi:MAG: hypothetical protein WC444_01120 [Candidatus Paceibacterota bacterium]